MLGAELVSVKEYAPSLSFGKVAVKTLVLALIDVGDTEQLVAFEDVRGYAVLEKVTSKESLLVRLFPDESSRPTVIRFVLMAHTLF